MSDVWTESADTTLLGIIHKIPLYPLVLSPLVENLPMMNVNMNPDNWEGVFERRALIGSEAFYLLNLYWYLSLPS